MIVGTGNSSLSQIKFYKKHGFQVSGIIRAYFDNDFPPIYENGIRCTDMIQLTCDLQPG